MTTLVLVRDAETTNRGLRSKIWKEVGHDPARFDVEVAQLDPDPGLSELGRVQAKEFAHYFTPLLFFFQEPLIVSSPMRSALETAMPLMRRGLVPPEHLVCHAGLFEIGSNLYRDERPSELAARVEADFVLGCCELPSDADYPAQSDAESDDQATTRVDRVCYWVHSALERGDHDLIILVAHRRLLSRCLRRWMGVPGEESVTFAHANTGITVLKWTREDGFEVECVNERRHLIDGARDSDNWLDHVGWGVNKQVHLIAADGTSGSY
jgi:broad specificity phosphatase PhoE